MPASLLEEAEVGTGSTGTLGVRLVAMAHVLWSIVQLHTKQGIFVKKPTKLMVAPQAPEFVNFLNEAAGSPFTATGIVFLF